MNQNIEGPNDEANEPHVNQQKQNQKTELLEHISDEGVRAANTDYVGQVGISADSFARMAAFAIGQPDELDINEILFRPTSQEL